LRAIRCDRYEELADLLLPWLRRMLVAFQKICSRNNGSRLLDQFLQVGDADDLDRIARQYDLDACLEDVEAILRTGLVLVVLVFQVAPNLVAPMNAPPFGSR
jgi:hypothetical protein